AIRHPRSRYRDSARLLQGESLKDAGACALAIGPLTMVADSGRELADRNSAALALGECLVETSDAPAARRRLAPLIHASDVATHGAPRLGAARAAPAAGDAASALADLDSASRSADAVFIRAAALALLGRSDESAALLSQAVVPFDEAQWRPALDALGRATPA